MEENNSTQNLSNDEVIDLFIEGIMNEKGVDAPTDEIRQSIHQDLKKRLLTEIDRSLVAELPDAKLNELSEKASASGGQLDPNVVAEAISEAGLDTTEIAGVTMQRFREIYLNPESNSATTKSPASDSAANIAPDPDQNLAPSPDQNPAPESTPTQAVEE